MNARALSDSDYNSLIRALKGQNGSVMWKELRRLELSPTSDWRDEVSLPPQHDGNQPLVIGHHPSTHNLLFASTILGY